MLKTFDRFKIGDFYVEIRDQRIKTLKIAFFQPERKKSHNNHFSTLTIVEVYVIYHAIELSNIIFYRKKKKLYGLTILMITTANFCRKTVDSLQNS